MCGIFGYINFGGLINRRATDELDRSVRLTSYRGPTHTGTRRFLDPGSDIFLGHNRLAIIDLSPAGNQPFAIGEDYHIVFNGEIYNYIELREILKTEGCVFTTGTDTEVLLRLYIQSGTSRFHELNGMWACIIYDRKKGKIVVSRDRFGEKPLYVLRRKGELFFGSEIKQLLPFVGESRMNRDAVASYLYYYSIDFSANTFFTGVTQIEASTCLTVDTRSGESRIADYWRFTEIDLEGESDEDLIREYRRLLESSVAIRLRSDVKIGNTLSGGLDSSSIAMLAHHETGRTLQNYSIISRGREVSEEHYVDALIGESGLNVVKIDFDELDPWQDIEKVIWHHDEPILSLSTVAHFKMMATLKRNSDITVVLSGQGGDESLAGYNKYFFFNIRDLAGQGKWPAAFLEAASIAPRFVSEFKLKYGARYLGRFRSVLGGDTGLDRVIALERPKLELGFRRNLRERQIEDIKRWSVPALCHYEDRNSMAHSLEIRLPFLDYRLMNFSVNLPNHLKIKRGVTKQILRRAMIELPATVRNRFDKKGFTVQEGSRMRPHFMKLLGDCRRESPLFDLSIVRADAFRAEIDLFQEGKSKMWERDLHRFLFLDVWARIFM